jgi:two-component system cell cycle sensor histidine kinase/response regulator CckA
MRLLREIRADVPIVLSSGFSEAEALRRFSNQRLAGFLQKPYTVRTLAEKLRSVMTRAAGHRDGA